MALVIADFAFAQGERDALRSAAPGINNLGAILSNQFGKLKLVAGSSAFTTTGTSKAVNAVTLDGQTLTHVLAGFVSYNDDIAATDAPWVELAVVNGQVTVKRAAGTTSAAPFSYFLAGY